MDVPSKSIRGRRNGVDPERVSYHSSYPSRGMTQLRVKLRKNGSPIVCFELLGAFGNGPWKQGVLAKEKRMGFPFGKRLHMGKGMGTVDKFEDHGRSPMGRRLASSIRAQMRTNTTLPRTGLAWQSGF